MAFGGTKKRPHKRRTLTLKYNIIRREKGKQKRIKKIARQSKNELRRWRRKDPGIPNSFPYKAELLAEIEAAKSAEREAKANRRREFRNQRDVMAVETTNCLSDKSGQKNDNSDIDMKSKDDFNNNKKQRGQKRSTNVAPIGEDDLYEIRNFNQLADAVHAANVRFGNSAPVLEGPDDDQQNRRMKSNLFRKELHAVIRQADIIIKVLDARDPNGCRCRETERRILEADKKLIFVLNKIDLVPTDVVKSWLTFLRRRAPAVAVKCPTGHQTSVNAANRKTADALTATAKQKESASQALGFAPLLQLLKNYGRVQKREFVQTPQGSNTGTAPSAQISIGLTVGVIGYPNVGKSSIVNALKPRGTSVKVGAEAGVTRHLQKVRIDKSLQIIDSPGVLLSGMESDVRNILRNSVKVSSVSDPFSVVEQIIHQSSMERILRFYQIPAFDSTSSFIASVAQVRGRLRLTGAPDIDAAARSILTDWTSGKIGHYYLPPTEPDMTEDSFIVPQFAAEFDVDKLFDSNEEELNRVASCGTVGCDDSATRFAVCMTYA